MQNPTQEQIEIWRKDPKNWKYGFNFYYNPDDKRIFPRKYYKEMGWTINFANTKSVIAFIVLILLVPALIFVISYFKK
jgi:uncharacterized membrane protein